MSCISAAFALPARISSSVLSRVVIAHTDMWLLIAR